MTIDRKQLPNVIPDNEETFILHIIGKIEAIDEYSSLNISKFQNSYKFRLSPSLSKYTNSILEEIIQLCNLFGIQLDISKSIKTSGIIFFKINL